MHVLDRVSDFPDVLGHNTFEWLQLLPEHERSLLAVVSQNEHHARMYSDDCFVAGSGTLGSDDCFVADSGILGSNDCFVAGSGALGSNDCFVAGPAALDGEDCFVAGS